MTKRLTLVCLLALVAFLPALAGREERKAEKAAANRAEIDGVAQEALNTLFEKSPKAKDLYGKAYGYAVFDNLKISLGLTGGGGRGVAVNKGTGARTYMKMGTGGLNLGLGGQKYQVVFLFQDRKTFDSFVEKGWQADASANAVAGTKGANAEATFRNGLAVFQLTKGGLMLQADISGTKYWKSKKLNR
jgi:lipid-binding SYLF domain-containing protein